jgi:hypothetical protein
VRLIALAILLGVLAAPVAALADTPRESGAGAALEGRKTAPRAPMPTRRHRSVVPHQPSLRIGLALCGAVLLVGGARLGSGPRWRRRLRDASLLGLGLTAATLYFDPATTLRREAIHTHDFFHYYLGAKFFRELGYTRLYECATVADLEDGLGARVERRRQRDLGSNSIRGTRAIVADPGVCKSHFDAKRWRTFRHDVRYFRRLAGEAGWERLLKDHGYNGTPAWAILGSVFAGGEAVTPQRVRALLLLDISLLAATAGVLAWAFGWRALCVGLVFLASFFPADSRWTTASYLRQDWLFASIAALALMKRGHTAAAGAALAWACSLRIFPVALLGGLGAKWLYTAVRGRIWRPSRDQLRFTAGFAGAAALLLVLSSALAGGPAVWRGFAQNASVHLDTPLLNYMGLKTAIAYHPATRSTELHDPAAADPLEDWKHAREEIFDSRRPIHGGVALLLGTLLVLAARREPDWAALALGVGLVPIAGELTSYYYVVFLGFSLLALRSLTTGVLVLLLGAVSQSAALWWVAVDDIYTVESVATVATVAGVLAIFAARTPPPRDPWIAGRPDSGGVS